MKKIQRVMLFVFAALLITGILPTSALAFDNTNWYWPVPDSLNLSQGYHSGHGGLDITASWPVNIVAARAGTVIAVYQGCRQSDGCGRGCSNCSPVAYTTNGDRWGISSIQDKCCNKYFCNYGIGNGVVIDHGNGVWTEYSHMETVSAYKGQQVKGGDVIGTMGSSGNSTGRHLHFAIKTDSRFGGQYPNGNAVNANPQGSEYNISPAWNQVRNIWYVRSYNALDLGDSFTAKIHLVADNMAITAVDSGNIELDVDRDIAGQDWRFDRMGNGSYIITSLKNGQVMDLWNGGTGNATNIGLCVRHPDGDSSQIYQRWFICPYGNDGYYRLVPEAAPSRSLDANGASTAVGTNIQLWDTHDSIAQKLSIDMFGGSILEGIVCSESSLTLKKGDSEQLEVSYRPWQAVPLNRRGVAWSSSDESVAGVDSLGYVTAYGVGTCTITVTSTYNDRFSSSCTVTVESGLQKPEITNIAVSGSVIRLSWSASPLMDENDDRGYEVFVYPKGNSDEYVWSDWNVEGTSCEIVLAEPGEYDVYVRAVNRTNGFSSSFAYGEFIVLGDEWMYFDELPGDLPECEIQYLNYYNDREQEECPGEGWTLARTDTSYVDGDVLHYEVPAPLEASDTLVPVGTFYYHYCDGNNTVEHYPSDRFRYPTHMTNTDQFDIVWQGVDDLDPRYAVYRLKWNSGEWAGGLASCAYGSSDAMSLYYLGYSYLERIAITTNVWEKESEWGSEIDPDADSVSYRIRNANFANRLKIPASTERIEDAAFMNNTMIQEVIVPDGCEYIGSKAFAGCTELKRVYIPENTVVEDDAFEGCSQVQIIRTKE